MCRYYSITSLAPFVMTLSFQDIVLSIADCELSSSTSTCAVRQGEDGQFSASPNCVQYAPEQNPEGTPPQPSTALVVRAPPPALGTVPIALPRVGGGGGVLGSSSPVGQPVPVDWLL